MKKNWKNILFSSFLVVGWMIVIFLLSARTDLKSDLSPTWDYIMRKIAHVLEFYILTYLYQRLLSNFKINLKISVGVSVFLAFIYSIFDEWHQSFVQNRVGTPIDVIIDGIGILSFGIIKIYEDKRKKLFN